MEEFKLRLRKARVHKGLTLSDLAFEMRRQFQITAASSQYSKYEMGYVFPSLRCFYALCKVLNVSADYLLGLSNKEELE